MNHRTFQRSLLTFGVLLTLLGFHLSLIVQPAPVALAAGSITGSVFQDYNDNGTRDAGASPNYAVDTGVAGVIVTAYDGSGAVQGTAATASDGTYTLAAASTGPYRVEFSALPSGFLPSAHGTNNNTTVQFVPDGTSSNVNLGIYKSEFYCQNNPNVASPCYRYGPATGNTNPTLYSYAYGVANNGTKTALATDAQIGTTWGLAHQRGSGDLFAAAFMRRHAGLGPSGTGAIYLINPASGNVSTFLDLNALFGAGTAGTDTHPPTTTGDWFHDAASFDQVGKIGLGGIAIDDADTTLYTVNLADRQLYRIPIGTTPTAPAASAISRYPVPLTPPGCASADVRPFATTFYQGLVYVGMTCTGQSTQATSDLQGYLYTFDPTNATWSSAPVFAFPLNYDRRCANDRSTTNCQNITYLSADWLAWTGTFPSSSHFKGGSGVGVYPQPWLTGIAFDNGNLVLGIRDRLGDQIGYNTGNTTAGTTTTYAAISAGDILRACGSAAAGWTLENNGTCGTTTTAGKGNTQGVGGGEYYYQDDFPAYHEEVSMGAVAQLPGAADMLLNVYDPDRTTSSATYSGGTRWTNNAAGTVTRFYTIYNGSAAGAGGKSNGLGDVTILCDNAPIEVGNRVWDDVNGNGVQDASEDAIAGVTVHLYAPNGTTVLGTSVTDASGNYYFSSAAGTSTTSAIYGIAGLTTSTTGFSVRLDNAANYAAGGVLAGRTLSPADATANSQDQRDSDATLVAGYPRITFNTGSAGANNHTYDVGFVPYSLGNRVWFDVNNNGLLDNGETGIANVAVNLFLDANADGAPDSATPLKTTTTDASGYYRFDDLVANSYVVQIDPTNFQTGKPLYNLFSSTTTETNPNADVDNNDNGLDAAAPMTAGISSGTVTLGPGGSEPTGETDQSASGQGSLDNQANLTVDFGFYKKLSLGNFVWYDTNNNGVFDAGEQPIAGVQVRLYADSNNNGTLDSTDAQVGIDQTTDANGQYLFTQLAAGNYFVDVLSANFNSTGTLAGYSNSSGTHPGNNNNQDHGTPLAGQDVVSEKVTLAYGAEPTDDGDSDANSNLSIDFGFYRLVIGNQLWRDNNNNGLLDAGEPGISGVRVELYTSANALVAATTTDANGQYTFNQQTDTGGTGSGVGLAPGDYYIKIPQSQFVAGSALGGYFNSDGQDTGDAVDNNDNGAPVNGDGIHSATFTLAPGAEPVVANASGTSTNTTFDFGFYTMSLGNFIWEDANNNGVFDTGEKPLQSVLVNLYYDANGNNAIDGAETTPFTFTRTDANGQYLFTGLAAGNYQVELPGSNFQKDGVYPGYASSTGVNGSAIGPYEPAPDPDNNTADGRDNGTETLSTLTINSGIITLVAGQEPTSAVETLGGQLADPAPDTNSNLTVDFGLIASVGIGNRVWIDANNNGAQDTGEANVPDGVVVNLYYDANGNSAIDGGETTAIATTTTSGGQYIFGPLVPGNYQVVLAASNFQTGGLLAGYTSSTGTNGSATGPVEPAPDPDDNPSDTDDNGTINGTLGSGGVIQSALTTLSFGGEPLGETVVGLPDAFDPDANETVDFGVFQPARVGDHVWYDTDHDGVLDPGETGVANVTVTLYNNANRRVVATTATNNNGDYLFNYLAPGSYYLVFSDLPTSYVITAQDQGGDDTLDSDANPISGQTAAFTLTTGQTNLTLDAGIYNDTRATVGDHVWYDRNENGILDNGEQGQGGVGVNLYQKNAGGMYVNIATVTTDDNGDYLFNNLLEGDYYVQFVLPNAGYAWSPQDQGGNDGSDSDANTTTGNTATFHVNPGANDLIYDAGLYYTRVSLGNYVWNDKNNNGLLDKGEQGIAGLTVKLFNATGTTEINVGPDGILGTADDAAGGTTTDANGFYLFRRLQPGTYVVEVTPPTGYRSSSGTNGALAGPYEPALDPDNDVDNDDNGTTAGNVVRAAPVTLVRGTEPTGETTAQPNPDQVTPDFNTNLTVDFGLYQPLSLGNLVWHDRNNNGVLDTGEPGLANVAVRLYDANNTLVASTNTDNNGNYLFTNLIANDYQVEITPPNGFASSTDIATSADPNNNVDSDDNGITANNAAIRSGTLHMAIGGEPSDDPGQAAGNDNRNLALDFGVYHPLTIGNLVWRDTNNNGLFDAGDSGIDGVKVDLYRRSIPNGQIDPSEFLESTTTAGGGLYTFSNLTPGDYYIILPASNFATGGALEHLATSTGGNSEPPPNANTDHTDNDDNGIAYQGQVASYAFTLVSGGEPTSEDGDANTDLTIDFGFYPLASVGDFVWLDFNNNGVQDTGENGVNNVAVQLYQPGPDGLAGTSDDVLVDTTSTDTNGKYLFADLVPGDYFVEFDLPTGYALSVQAQGGDPTRDSDADPQNGRTPITTLAAGQNNLDLDAGINYTASLGDRVWLDQNANGIQDAGEQSLANVSVTLFTSTGTQVGTPVVTDANGTYTFAHLPPGDYYVQVTPPTGFLISPAKQGSDPASDSDADSATGKTPTITVALGTQDTAEDFGLYQLVSVGNFVWRDINNNGVVDNGETGIGGVTVNLYRDTNGNGQIDTGEFVGTATTDNTGHYVFNNLVPAVYLAEVPASNFAVDGPLQHDRSSTGANSEADNDPNDDVDNDDNGTVQSDGSVLSKPIVLTSQHEPANDGDADTNTNLTVDFGFYPLASIGDFVWLDQNANGVQDTGEPGIPNITVRLYAVGADGQLGSADDTLVATTKTDANGKYLFGDLVPGDYFAQFDLPQNYVFSPEYAGGNTAVSSTTDSSVDPSTGFTAVTRLAPGQQDTSEDAGITYSASLGNNVWFDRNANGVLDTNEPDLQGAMVTLYTSAGVQIGAPVITDPDGNYTFEHLPPGDYYVVFTPPTSYLISPQGRATNPALDSNPDPSTGRTAIITVGLDTRDTAIDAGMYQLVSLGNLVWRDINNNGVVDSGEMGIDGVALTLYRDVNGNGQIDAGEAAGTTNTSGGGLYLFNNLVPGSYLVQIAPSNFARGSVLAGYASSAGAITTNANPRGPYEPAPDPNNDVDNDDNGTAAAGQGIVSGPIALADGNEPVNDGDADSNSNLTLDFGVFQASSIGSLVWNDANRNGIHDPSEAGMAGITVTLYNAAGTVLVTTATDSKGAYQFADLLPGTYSLGFGTLPDGYTFTSANKGGNTATDSDANPTTGRTTPITIGLSQDNSTIFAGLITTNPTAISLASFTATRQGDDVAVRWVTTAEVNTLGFRVYRSADGARAHAVQATSALIPSTGRGQNGATYSWIDKDATPGATFTYWLQETEASGATHEYGPIRVLASTTRAANTLFNVYVPLVTR